MYSSNHHAERNRRQTSSLLAPWLATGIGLAALSAIGDGGISEPAAAAPPPVRAGVELRTPISPAERLAAASDALAAEQVAPALTVDDLAGEAAYTGGGSPLHPRMAELFSVAGNLVKPLPEDYHHDLLSEYRPFPTDEEWAALRACESSGNYQAVNFSGRFRGAYQFDVLTWQSVGGVGDPIDAEPAEQDLRALKLYLSRGAAPWPECGRFLPEDPTYDLDPEASTAG